MPGVSDELPDGAGGARALGLAPRHAAALAWLGAWISGATVLWLVPDQPFVRRHAAHATVLLGGLMLFAMGAWSASLLMAFVSAALFRVLAWTATLAWGLMGLTWLVGLVQALRGRSMAVPYVSSWAMARLEGPGLPKNAGA